MQTQYEQALKKVLDIKKQRQKVYGDNWLENPINFDIWMLYGKIKRALYILKNGNNDYEKMEDTLIDITNYSLFALVKSQKKSK